MKIQPVVEGHGDVQALPVLLRRFTAAAESWGVEIGTPIRQPRGRLVNQESLVKAVRIATRQPACGAVLILLDGDDDCPAELGPRINAWARTEARDLPCEVVVAHREYEAWFLASIESLRGQRGIRDDAPVHAAPEDPRDAKGRLEERMIEGRSYIEMTDQPALSELFSLGHAHQRSRSFRKLAKSFGALVRGMGRNLGAWPPSSWASGP